MPPIYFDEWSYFNRKKNRAFGYCDTTMMLACQDGRPVGRIMGIINRRHNQHVGERTARFACLECVESHEVAQVLLGHVEQWARTRGMTKVIGPFGFTDQDPEGFMIEGFEHPPAIVTYYNFPFITDLLKAAGYAKDVDYFVYRIPVPAEVPALMAKVAERAKRHGFREVALRNKRDLRMYLIPMLRLLDETFIGIYGYSPLVDVELADLAKRFLPLIDVRFVKIVVRDDDVVGFMVGLPDLHKGIVRSKGHLFPFGLLHILRAAKRAKQLDLLVGGIREQYRGRGIDALLGQEMTKSAAAAGFEYFDSHHELEVNWKVRAEMERWGGQVWKKYRVYQRGLED
jgi:GNAT superfamily N-acetyltransferase